MTCLAGSLSWPQCCYWFFVLPLFRSVPGATWQAAAVSAIYPVVGLMIVVVMSLATGRWRSYHWRSWERLIAAAFLLYGAGLMITPIAVIQMKSAGPTRRGLCG